MENLHVEFELPTVLASQAGINLENPAPEIRKMVALFLYEHHRISLGKACGIGGFSHLELHEKNSLYCYGDQVANENNLCMCEAMKNILYL
jgi:hypothetical protein